MVYLRACYVRFMRLRRRLFQTSANIIVRKENTLITSSIVCAPTYDEFVSITIDSIHSSRLESFDAITDAVCSILWDLLTIDPNFSRICSSFWMTFSLSRLSIPISRAM